MSERASRGRWFQAMAAGLLLGMIAGCGATPQAKSVAQDLTKRPGSDIERYIAEGWDVLRRSPLNCGAMVDPKLPQGQSIVYLPADEEVTPAMKAATDKCGVQIRNLPEGMRVGAPVRGDMKGLERQGLLYLPNDYVVPGGRFNEMYGWDSFFILEGLIEAGKRGAAGRVALARGMTENFFYELDHYGAVLNANRTYYLTRSQPPFLTSMVLDVEQAMADGPLAKRQWLERGYRAGGEDWAYWNRPEMKAGETGLSRYYDYGTGGVPEMQDDPAYYQNVVSKLVTMGADGRRFLREVSPEENSKGTKAPRAVDAQTGKVLTLTDDFYKGDRAMRASGFDVSFRFGPYGGATHHFAPVCLNSLLYKEECDLATMAERLGKADEARQWHDRAEQRKAAMRKYLWDPEAGTFFDYDFMAGERSHYAYATMFFPLWCGVVTQQEAASVVQHLAEFDKPGGVAMSTQETGVQWDLPFGWAPVQLLTVEGLRRYGFETEAGDVSEKWLRMIVQNFRREGTLREKYNVVTRSADVNVEVGYAANVVGFGWTNGVFLKLIDSLPANEREKIVRK